MDETPYIAQGRAVMVRTQGVRALGAALGA
jgi:hypothetical protein